MKINFTEQEKEERKEFESRYKKLIKECVKIIEEEAPKNKPEIPANIPMPQKPESEDNNALKKYQAQIDEYIRLNIKRNEKMESDLKAWRASGSEKWKKANQKYDELLKELIQIRKDFVDRAERRQFSELGDDKDEIMDNAKSEAIEYIKAKISFYHKEINAGMVTAEDIVIDTRENTWFLEEEATRRNIKESALRLHYEHFREDSEALAVLDSIIDETIAEDRLSDKPHVSRRVYDPDSNTVIVGFPGEIEINGEPADLSLFKKEFRTIAKAGDITKAPDKYAIPTLENYQYSISLYPNGNAYLQPLDPEKTHNLVFENGILKFQGSLEGISEVELQDMKTEKGIESIDLPRLKSFYSIILKKFEENDYKKLDDVINMYVPDLAEYLGLQRNLSDYKITDIQNQVKAFHNIVGVLHFHSNGKPRKSLYPVLVFMGYDAKKNIISFSSPYMNYLIKAICEESVKRDKKGEIIHKTNGEPLRLPTHSYLVRPEIASEKNKVAVENVMLIVRLIETAGENIARIKASTLIERNPQLVDRLNESKNKVQLLQRVFKKTWELLGTHTRLKEVYKDIELPDPKDPRSIPTPARLNDTIFEFRHDGKIKRK